MSQAVLRGVLPVGMGLIVCTMGVLFLSATGLLHEPASEEPEMTISSSALRDSTATDSAVIAGSSEPAVMTAEQKRWYPIGEALFKGNCAQCHAVQEQVVGPALSGVAGRHSEKWLQSWIKNSAKVVASGDPYAVALYDKFGKQQMPSFQLTDEEISAILTYIQVEENKPGYMVSATVVID